MNFIYVTGNYHSFQQGQYRVQTTDSRLEPEKPARIPVVTIDPRPLSVILRPDFEDQFQKQFLKVLHLYYVHEHDAATKIVDQALSQCRPGMAAISSFRALSGGLQLYMPWKTASQSYELANEAHLEDHIALLFETTRVWLSTTDSSEMISNLEQRLANQSNEVLSWIPMPPEVGAIVSDIKVFARIFYHFILTHPKRSKKACWKALSRQEQVSFHHLCRFLLAGPRPDLLVKAIDMRSPPNSMERSWTKALLRKATKAITSQYHIIKCQIRSGDKQLVIRMSPGLTQSLEARIEDVKIYVIDHDDTRSVSQLLMDTSTFQLNHTGSELIFLDIQTLRNIHWYVAALRYASGKSSNSDFALQNFGSCGMRYHYQCSLPSTNTYMRANTRDLVWSFEPKLDTGLHKHGTTSEPPHSGCSSCDPFVASLNLIEKLCAINELNNQTLNQLLPTTLMKSIEDSISLNILLRSLWTCLYIENILRTSKSPLSTQYYLLDTILHVYEYWFLPICLHVEVIKRASLVPHATGEKSTGEITKLCFIACLRFQCAPSKELRRKAALRLLFYMALMAPYVLKPQQYLVMPLYASIIYKLLQKYRSSPIPLRVRYEECEISCFAQLVRNPLGGTPVHKVRTTSFIGDQKYKDAESDYFNGFYDLQYTWKTLCQSNPHQFIQQVGLQIILRNPYYWKLNSAERHQSTPTSVRCIAGHDVAFRGIYQPMEEKIAELRDAKFEVDDISWLSDLKIETL